ncbi:uncharacterized protein LOC111358130 isoform X2 [Spodoptera litura]|uniref:Uncharacterized protein LOC111358130 isoform X2 n=1 Tax=Spodoptera litura TaxID=69820 RepID=A0A9J7EHK1_SPOLT|nr:uncharacterized protein LOC111358130 isoform X2 [Spodoptera litura]
MSKILSLIFVVFVIICHGRGHSFAVPQSVYGSTLNRQSNQLISDADLQSALMPQELNPAYVPEKDAPWRAVIPLGRQRRDIDGVENAHAPATVSHSLKVYSRMATCIALAIAAIVEIILYVIEFYTVS